MEEAPPLSDIILPAEDVEEILVGEVGESALFTSRFREAAARALLLPKRRPGSRTPLWLQRRKAANLLEIAKGYGSFPIVLETYREVIQDHFDLPSLREVLSDVASRKTRVVEVETSSPSPFASSLMFDFIASFIYEYDAPVAERRAAALTLDRRLLAELLGEPEFRELLDGDVIDQVERELQHLADDRRADSSDRVHDLVRDLGPLSRMELATRVTRHDELDVWVDQLIAERRATWLTMRGENRLSAVEDVARLRDAVGVQPPPGMPEALLEPVADPLGDVIGRFARTHGPFSGSETAESLGLPRAVVEEVLERLEAEGRVASGAYRPLASPGATGAEREWVDLEVLRRLRRRSLAVLRSEVEAVDEAALGTFLPAWHGVGSGSSRPDRLLDVVRQLDGAELPAGIVERDVLPSRLDYEPARLDDLLSSGEVVWAGRGPLGPRNGRLAFYVRDHTALLHRAPAVDAPEGQDHHAIRAHLEGRGASFFRDIYDACGGGDPETVLAAIWDLVWAGEVTNDTLAPLRAHLWGKARSGGRRSRNLLGSTPPSGTGRWYLVRDLLAGDPTPEERATSMVDTLLERHGVVTRDAVSAEGVPGGFSGIYPVLASMEDVGKVRRGYFIEGLGGAQFGLPGAIDRLRSSASQGVVTLAAADPANPYGAALPWPEGAGGRPGRKSGAYVGLVDGVLSVYVEPGGRTATTFGMDLEPCARALASIAPRHRSMTLETIDGILAASAGIAPLLVEVGFVNGYRGLVFDPKKAATRA